MAGVSGGCGSERVAELRELGADVFVQLGHEPRGQVQPEMQVEDRADPAALLAAARADDAVAVVEPVGRAEASLTAAALRYDTLLVVLPADTTLHHFTDRGGTTLELPDRGGVLLGEGLRRLLDVDVGDTVALTLADGSRVDEPVAGFVDEPMSPIDYVSLRHLDDTLERPMTTGALVQLHAGADREPAATRLGQLPGAAAYFHNAALEATLRQSFNVMDVLLAVMLAFAVIMAAALLYNDMSANLAERAVGLGTLDAAGIARVVLARLVATENLLLTAVGIPIGLVTGPYLAGRFMRAYENRGLPMGPRLQGTTMFLVVAAVLVGTVASRLPVLRGLRRIDVATIVRGRSL